MADTTNFPTSSAPYPAAHAAGTVWPQAIKAYIDEQIRQAVANSIGSDDLADFQNQVSSQISGGLGVWVADLSGAFTGPTPQYDKVLYVGKDSSDYTQAGPGDFRLRVADSDWA